MRKIIVFNRISLDGFFAGPNGEIDWFIHDPAVDQAAHEMMNPDTLLMGRLTYQMFAGYWPSVMTDPNASKEARITADELSQMTKLVFSSTLDQATWQNTRLVKGDLIKEIRTLKQAEGADITIFGSGSIVQQLAKAELIDEYLIIITPVVLGKGKSFFKDLNAVKLFLKEVRNFKSGNIVVHYTT